jgi:hypothetical protein
MRWSKHGRRNKLIPAQRQETGETDANDQQVLRNLDSDVLR